MRRKRVSLAIVSAILATLGLTAGADQGGRRGGGPGAPVGPPMAVAIPAFADGTVIPDKYTANSSSPVSPEINWTNAPPGTQSLVLHMRDPDVTRNRTVEDQLHWLVWNIPPAAKGLPENVAKGPELPDGSRQTSASGPVYRAPGAPATAPMHHYTFEVFALDITLDVANGEDPFEVRKAVLSAMNGHVLGKGAYVGLFHRTQ